MSGRDPLARFPTGVPGLDEILAGGFFRGSSNLVVGSSGTGKTVLASQIAFHHVAQGGRAGFLTLLTESHERLLGSLATLSFFDPRAIADTLYFVSGAAHLKGAGTRGALAMAQGLIRDRRLTLLVVDGAEMLEAAAPSFLEAQSAIHELHGFLATTGCTALFLSGSRTTLHDGAIPDSNVYLEQLTAGVRSARELHVGKLRGSSFLLGRHAFTIGPTGVHVYPRTEARAARLGARGAGDGRRLSLGVPRLDDMLSGGVTAGSSTSVLGAPGSGKTLLAVSFLAAGARGGEAGAYFGFYEDPARLAGTARGIGLDLDEHLRSGALELRWCPPMERALDPIAEDILRTADERRLRRVVIDGVDALRLAAVHEQRLPSFLTALLLELRARDVGTLVTEQTDLFPPGLHLPAAQQVISAMVDNLVLLRYVELRARLHRLVSVLKVRVGPADPALREFRIGAQGIDVASGFEGAERILTGVATEGARPTPAPRRRTGRRR